MFIRLIIEVYVDIIVAAGVRLIKHDLDNRYEIAMTALAAFMALFALIFFAVILVLINRNKSRLEDEEFQAKYGELIESVDINADSAAYYWVFFLMQRIT